MPYENLTRKQQDLLRWMVLAAEETRESDEFQGIRDVSGPPSKILLIAPGGDDDCVVDLETLFSLQNAQLISLKNPNKRDAIAITCSLRELAFEAVKNNFLKPHKTALPSNATIGTYIAGNMSGGHIQSVGSNLDELKQIANDPQQFQVELFKLTDQIIDEVRKSAQDISVQERVQYEKAIQELKEELLAQQPEPSKMKRLFRTIGFLGDIEGNISLMMRIWPYAYPLLIMALEKAKI